MARTTLIGSDLCCWEIRPGAEAPLALRHGSISALLDDLPLHSGGDPAPAVDAESLVFDVAGRRVTTTLRALGELLPETLSHLEVLYDRGEMITGVPTGYIDLDEEPSGLQPSSLTIVGARPAAGKTSFALGTAAHAAIEAQIPVLLFSLEMSHAEIAQRLLVSEGRVDSNRIRNGRLLANDWPKIDRP